jgi:membrane associated rhomboid family serine protease
MDPPPAIACYAILAVTAFCSYLGFTRPAFFEKYLFDTAAILRGRQYYRLISSSLVHVDVAHLAFNLFSFYAFGCGIERIFGAPTLLAIYLASIVGGDLVSLVLHRRHEYRAVGASGGVCGVIYASIFLLPGGAVQIFFIPIDIPAWAFAIGYLGFSFFGLRRQAGLVGHEAHLGGAVIGLLVATALYPQIVSDSPGLYGAVIGLSLLIIAYLYKFPLYLGRPDIFNRAWWRNLGSRLSRRVQRQLEADEEKELDRLLRKISETGLDSLSRSERNRLDAISRRRSKK